MSAPTGRYHLPAIIERANGATYWTLASACGKRGAIAARDASLQSDLFSAETDAEGEAHHSGHLKRQRPSRSRGVEVMPLFASSGRDGMVLLRGRRPRNAVARRATRDDAGDDEHDDEADGRTRVLLQRGVFDAQPRQLLCPHDGEVVREQHTSHGRRVARLQHHGRIVGSPRDVGEREAEHQGEHALHGFASGSASAFAASAGVEMGAAAAAPAAAARATMASLP